ncbi:uncharacterized protein [Dermacentor albipictus]|uniref:uncharacterized protein n=1 Tax=Dermacentor albipictus TaxID=60249 RepID=UPI0038FC43E6
MSDWSDSSEAADSDTSDVLPRLSRPWDEKKAAAKRAKAEHSSPWMWYYNLSAKKRRAEDERIAKILAPKAAEYREIEKFELTYAPFEYRTRGSSLSPNTPPPRGLRVPASSTVAPASAGTSTSNEGLPEPPREPPRKAQPHRRVLFRLADGSVVSSSDDEDTHVSRCSLKMLVCSDDDNDVGSPPTTSDGRVDDIASGADVDASATGLAAQLSQVRETPGALPRSVREEHFDRASGDPQRASSSSSLTRADVIGKRSKSIEGQRSLLEEICSGHRSSSDESSRNRSFRRTSVVTPTGRSVAGRPSSVRRTLCATPSPTSSVKDPLCLGERGRTPPSLRLSSDDSATTSFAKPRARTSSGPLCVLHSTPHGAPRGFLSLRDSRGSDSAASRGTLVSVAGASGTPCSGRRLQALDRGQVLVISKQVPESQEGTNLVGQPPTGPASAAPSPASRCHDESSIARRSVDAAEWSTAIRFGVGSSRERVLLSDALSPLSALASFCARSRSCSSQAAQDSLREQREQAPAARDDPGPATVQQQLLKHCQQESPVTFEVALRLTDDCRRCLKLGEGCTADVYRIRRPSGHESAVKVIPVGGSRNEDGELPMSLSSVILECVMTRELSNLRFNEANQSSNFIELKRTHSVRGTYHPVLMKSWKDYDNQSGSENSDPALFQETQHYVLLEFEFGGKTLERSKATIEQLESVFLQVACALAVAERELEFEHRDLHCDNVLVKPTEEQFAEFVLHGRKVRVRTAGVKASVIDYTLSRTRIGGQVCFTDLSKDAAIFQGTGSVQYDVYRTMKEHNGDDWEAFRPHTNVLWLHYLLTKLFRKLPKRKQVSQPSTSRGRLAAWMDVILSLPSAEQFVVGQVLPHLERDAEAPRRATRAKGPHTEQPHAMNRRAHR